MAQSELSKGLLEIANKTQVLGWDWWLVAFAVNQRTHDPALQPPIPPSSFQLDVWPRTLDLEPLFLNPSYTPVGPVQIIIKTSASWKITSASALTFTPSSGVGQTVVTITGSGSQWSAARSLPVLFTVSNGIATFTSNNYPNGYTLQYNGGPPQPNTISWPSSFTLNMQTWDNIYPNSVSSFSASPNGVYVGGGGQGTAPSYSQSGGFNFTSLDNLSLDDVPQSQYPANVLAIETGAVCSLGNPANVYVILGYNDNVGGFNTAIPTCPISGLVVGQNGQGVYQSLAQLTGKWIEAF